MVKNRHSESEKGAHMKRMLVAVASGVCLLGIELTEGLNKVA
jgi:hypothetical protein